ncbi:alpha-amylase [Actinomycetaceae bacterium TAE3-ERU4]|nr:alpha-amylase [Actinomycetaceae bacterium TAE3-ERU4]
MTDTWISYSQWWHVYPLGALGADTTGSQPILPDTKRTLKDLIVWMDYARDLGLNGLLLGPIFASEYHGYDTLDYFEIDSRLGDLEDFQAFVDAAHQRGIKVMLDGVFNHVSKNSPLAQVQSDGTWLIKRDDTGSPICFEGHEQLVELDHNNPQVTSLITKVMTYWADLGIDGWRLDAAYALTPANWAKITVPFKKDFPHIYLLGEVIHGDYPLFVKESGIDSITQYELWKAIWSSLQDTNMHELAWCLKRHNEFCKTFLPWTFIGNHDVTRIISKVGEEKSRLALVLLCILPGIPAIYYGDEIEMKGIKEERIGGDDEIRPELPDLPPENLPSIYRLHQLLLGLRRRIPTLVNGYVHTLTCDKGALLIQINDREGTTLLTAALNSNPYEYIFHDVAGTQVAAEKSSWVDSSTLCLSPNGWSLHTPQ